MANDLNLKDFVISKTKPPLYLEEILEEDRDVTVVFQRGKTTSNSVCDLLETMDITTNTSLNLTGRPLEIDLSITSSSLISEVLPNKLSDVNYKPMSLCTARKFTDYYNKHLKKEVGRPPGIYCICDASDEKSTVVLGSNVSDSSIVTRTLVFACGSVEEFRNPRIMDQMLNQHILNVEDIFPKIETNVNCFYDVYGYKLNPCNVDTSINSGCIEIEANWNTNEFNTPEYGAVIKMFLQVVVSHENSLMFPIFQKLLLLQTCLEILKEGAINDNTILCNSIDVEEDLSSNLYSVLHDVSYMKTAVVPQDMQQALAYIEGNNLTDKLWNILSCSSTVENLKNAINSLFITINNEPVRVQILDDDLNTNLGNIIKNLYEGKMILPTLTSKQSLEILIDLGLQKIKKVYVFIIKSYDFAVSNNLNDRWSTINSASDNKSKRSILDHFNDRLISKNINFLYSVHIMLEFLQLVEQNYTFTKEVGISVLKNAYSKFVNSKSGFDFNQKKQIFDLVFPVSYMDIKLITDCLPLKWKIKMTSMKTQPWHSSVTTLFHYSRKPIFPENVYKYKDAEFLSDDDLKYFVTQLESYSDKLPV